MRINIAGPGRVGAAGVIVGVSSGQGLHDAASLVVRHVGRDCTSRYNLTPTEAPACAAALLRTGPDFISRAVLVRRSGEALRLVVGTPPQSVEVAPAVCDLLAHHLLRHVEGYRAVVGEIGGV